MCSLLLSPRRLLFLSVCIFVSLSGCAVFNQSLNQIEKAVSPAKSPENGSVAAPTFSIPASAPEADAAMLPADRTDLASLSPDLTKYQIDLSLDYATHSFQAHSRVAYTNTEDAPLDRLYFRLLPNGHKSYGDGSLTVSQTRVGGKPVQTHLSLSDSVLELSLSVPLVVGEGTQLDFDYSGVLPVDFGGNEGTAGYGIYDSTQGVITLSGWYPILAVDDAHGWHLDPVSSIGDSVYSETALYRVNVTADKDLVLASSGVETGEEKTGNTVTHHLVSGPARDFVIVLGVKYSLLTQTVGGIRLNSFYLPGHQKGGEMALQVVADALRIYDQRFGSYPYAEMDVVETPLRYALGVEYPEIVFISSSLYGDPEGINFAGAVSHEVAHQWWYGVVGNDVFNEPWLDEALATYSSSLYYEDQHGAAGYQGYIQYLQGRYDQLLSSGKDDLVTQPLAYFETLNDPSVYSRVVYSKGALFFKAVRDQIGDQAFFAALHNYYQARKYKVATAQDLLSAFETESSQPLNDLIQTWLYSPEK